MHKNAQPHLVVLVAIDKHELDVFENFSASVILNSLQLVAYGT